MHDLKYYETYEFRGTKDNGELPTWKETLERWCKSYGKFSGRWHTNDFWANMLIQLSNMTEGQAEQVCRKIERDADADLDYWRIMQ